MLQAPHEAPSNAVDLDITHRPLPLETSVVYLTSASVRLIRPGSGAFPIHWTGRLSPRDLLRLGPWKLLHRPLSCLRPLHASRRPPRSRDAPVLGLGVHNARDAVVLETCTVGSVNEVERLAGPPRACFHNPRPLDRLKYRAI